MDNLVQELAIEFQSIEIAEPQYLEGFATVAGELVERKITASILAKFAAFLADNADSLPTKDAVLDILSKAIDLAFTALNKPFITSILKPRVKAAILRAAGNLYVSIVSTTPAIEV